MTDQDKVRLLIGDQAKILFTDDEIQAFLDLNDGSVFYACALACDQQAAKIGSALQEVSLGDFRDLSGRNQVTSLQKQAEAFRDWEENTPAFGIAEQGLSDFNYLTMIRNYILRTEPETST